MDSINNPTNDNVRVSYPEKVDKETIIKTLAEEGMMLTVDKLEDVKDEQIILAQHNVIVKMRKDLFKLNTSYLEQGEDIKRWYRAAQKVNLSVSRNGAEIVLTKVS